METFSFFLTRADYDAALPFVGAQMDAFLDAERRWTAAGVTLSFPSLAAFDAFVGPLSRLTDTDRKLRRIAALPVHGMHARLVAVAQELAAVLDGRERRKLAAGAVVRRLTVREAVLLCTVTGLAPDRLFGVLAE